MLRELRLDLCADRPHRSVLDADRRASPSCAQSEHLFFRLSDPHVVEFLERWTRRTPLQPEVFNKIQEWLGERRAARRSTTGTSPATRPISASRSPTSPASTSTSGWTRRSATWRPQEALRLGRCAARLPTETRTFEEFIGDPRRRAVSLHRQGHRLLPHAVLAGDAAFLRSARRPTNVFVHGFITCRSARRCRSRAAPASARSATSSSGMNPEWLRYYLAAKLNDRVEDLDFNPDDFVARVNSDLVGKYVNIASRAAPFLTKISTEALARRRARQRLRAIRRSKHGPSRTKSATRTTTASTARRCATSWATRTGSTNTSTARSRGSSPRIPAQRERAARRLQRLRSRLPAMTVMLKPVLPRLARAASASWLGSTRPSRGTDTWHRARRASAPTNTS